MEGGGVYCVISECVISEARSGFWHKLRSLPCSCCSVLSQLNSLHKLLRHKTPIKCLSKCIVYLSNEQLKSTWHKNVKILRPSLWFRENFCSKQCTHFLFYLECTWLGVSEIMGNILTYHLEITLTIPMYNH